jgi:predicted lipid-binding transport protein (Tim44 family)
MDLALVDARFAPDVLEAAVRRAVAAWLEAVDGDDAPLRSVASADAVEALLYGGDSSGRTRTVVRGVRVERITIASVDVGSEPARMTVEVAARGRRYVEDRDTADVLRGSRHAERSFEQRWTFALDGADATPWRLVGLRVGSPEAA